MTSLHIQAVCLHGSQALGLKLRVTQRKHRLGGRVHTLAVAFFSPSGSTARWWSSEGPIGNYSMAPPVELRLYVFESHQNRLASCSMHVNFVFLMVLEFHLLVLASILI